MEALFILTIFIGMFEKTSAIDAKMPNPSLCKTSGIKGMRLPDLPKYFSTNIQINVYDVNNNGGYSKFVEESFDQRSGKGSVFETKYFHQTRKIYDLKNEEIMSLKNLRVPAQTTCNVSKMTDRMKRYNFRSRRFFSPVGIMVNIEQELSPSTMFYKESSTASETDTGIVSNVWRSCFFDKNRNSTFLIRYFWSNDTLWTGANCNVVIGSCPTIPVKLEISERGRFYDNMSSVKRHVFLFSNFISRQNTADLLAPQDVYCNGASKTKHFPVLPLDASFNVELVHFIHYNSRPTTHYYEAIKYNFMYKLSYRNNNRGKIVITDELNDVEYVNNLEFNSCTQQKLQNLNTSGQEYFFGSISSYYQLLAALDLTDEKYSYNGMHNVRGIPSHAFVGEMIRSGINYIVQWYFEDVAGSPTAPLKIVKRIAGYEYKGKFELHITAWNTDVQRLNVYDVTNCFSQENTTAISIEFKTDQDPHKYTNTQARNQILRMIIKTMKIRLQRIGSFKISIRNSSTDFKVNFKFLPLTAYNNYSEVIGELDSKSAIEELQHSVQHHHLNFSVFAKDGKKLFLYATSVSITVQEPSKEMKSNDGRKYSVPISFVVIIALAMLMFGTIIGAVGLYASKLVNQNRKKKSHSTHMDNLIRTS